MPLALRCHSYCEPEDLSLDVIDAPQAGEGEVVLSVKAAGVNFPDKVSFHYEGPAPLVYVPEKCGEFLRQLRGRAKPLPTVKDLIFGSEYEEAARAKLLVNGSVSSLFFLFRSLTFSYNFHLLVCLGR